VQTVSAEGMKTAIFAFFDFLKAKRMQASSSGSVVIGAWQPCSTVAQGCDLQLAGVWLANRQRPERGVRTNELRAGG